MRSFESTPAELVDAPVAVAMDGAASGLRVTWFGPKRWYPSPVALRELPRIDVVMISHDHYDHLDRSTIAAMVDWATTFVAPFGVGAHLEPVERVLAAAKCRNVDVLVPRPGESIEPAGASPRVRWWPEIPWLSAHETPIVATRDGVASHRFDALPCDPSSG